MRKEHRVALNQLTKVLNKNHPSTYKLYGDTSLNVRPLDRIDRVIHNPAILEELNNRCTAHLSSTTINESEDHAVGLLRKHHNALQDQSARMPPQNRQEKLQKATAYSDQQQSTSHESLHNIDTTSRSRADQPATPTQTLRRSARLRKVQEHAELMGSTKQTSETYSSQAHPTQRGDGERIRAASTMITDQTMNDRDIGHHYKSRTPLH